MHEFMKRSREIFASDVVPLAKKYSVAIGVFLFGLHLHAQAFEWNPFWDREDAYESESFPETSTSGYESLLSREIYGDEELGQIVTARWLMTLGILIWVGARYDLFQRLGKRS